MIVQSREHADKGGVPIPARRNHPVIERKLSAEPLDPLPQSRPDGFSVRRGDPTPVDRTADRSKQILELLVSNLAQTVVLIKAIATVVTHSCPVRALGAKIAMAEQIARDAVADTLIYVYEPSADVRPSHHESVCPATARC